MSFAYFVVSIFNPNDVSSIVACDEIAEKIKQKHAHAPNAAIAGCGKTGNSAWCKNFFLDESRFGNHDEQQA
ncbi:MAG: hypothetical protein RBT80_23295 [Candidatus Vecturithrix sp.]|nr:hypothetical protein [Candidatus Vecturithrix sp.]